MNRSLTIALSSTFIVLSFAASVQARAGKAGFGPPAMARPFLIADCTVRAIDLKTMRFVCDALSIQVSETTAFQFGNVKSSFSNLKVGKAVTITYLTSDTSNVADSVTAP